MQTPNTFKTELKLLTRVYKAWYNSCSPLSTPHSCYRGRQSSPRICQAHCCCFLCPECSFLPSSPLEWLFIIPRVSVYLPSKPGMATLSRSVTLPFFPPSVFFLSQHPVTALSILSKIAIIFYGHLGVEQNRQ